MNSCVVLGRDVLKLFQLVLTEINMEEVETVNTIMNININSSADTNVNSLLINPEMEDNIKVKLKQLFT